MRFDPSDHSTASEAQVVADAQARKTAVDNAMALAQENSRNEQLTRERVDVKA